MIVVLRGGEVLVLNFILGLSFSTEVFQTLTYFTFREWVGVRVG